MQPNEFVLWFKGFTEGAHDYNITPKQWDLVKEKLSEVSDSPFAEPSKVPQVSSHGITLSPNGSILTGTADPLLCQSTTVRSGANSVGFTDGVTSYSISVISGSNWSYTTTTDKTLLND